MKSPLRYVREYITVMRDLLWQGRTDFEGEFFRVHAALPQGILPPRTPLLLSALRVNAFRQAGEIADGAISWVCPIPYLMHTALPALRSGAEEAGRSAPPLIAHVPVTIGEGDTRAVGREYLRRYARLPFYARMFEAAGYPVPGDGGVPDALLDGVVVSGTGPQVVERLQAILREGVDEVLVSVLPVADAHAEEGALIDALGASGG
jgi:alkanesulfonate monooxygenase SsuD/methylene tetrahydromethanopterin reductase-like flavin-dependent oxidoreductase (luciferase family)